jgi:hypothetical protein
MVYRNAEPLKTFYHAWCGRRSCDSDAFQRAGAASPLFQMLQQIVVKRRDAGGDGYALAFNQLGGAGRVQFRTRQYQFCSHHRRRVSKSPGTIGVKHRRHRQDRILRHEPETASRAESQGVQHVRSMGIQYTFGIAGRS